MPLPFVISMYSFKGGAGRTVCTANLAPRLATALNATAESPLLMLDFDLDSAGLTILLNEDRISQETTWDTATLLKGELNLGIPKRADKFSNEGMVDVTEALRMKGRPGVVRLVAGPKMSAQQSSDLLGKLNYKGIDSLIRFAEDRRIPAILIDSASGQQKTAVMSHKRSHVVVYCCRLTYQFIAGTEKHLNVLLDECEMADPSGERRTPPKILLLPMAVPEVVSARTKDIYELRMGALHEMCQKLHNRTYADVIDLPIPEVDSFKWNESVLNSGSGELALDEQRAAEAFDALNNRILKCHPSRQAAGLK